MFNVCWHQLPHGANCLTSCCYQVRARNAKLVEQTEARVGSHLCSLLTLCKVLSIRSVRETTETIWEELCRDSLREFLPRMCAVTVSFYISRVYFIPIWSVGRKNNDWLRGYLCSFHQKCEWLPAISVLLVSAYRASYYRCKYVCES